MITLTTDFGSSAYVGAMRGAILSVHREATLVDLTHDVPSHDIQAGAFALFSAVPFFPEGTVHVGVVDPGVGTDRPGVALEAGGHLLVGPDNGLLMPAARRLGLERAFELTNAKLFLDQVSRTFHGRDIFGPVAGHLAMGVELEDVGPQIAVTDLEDLTFGEPFIEEGEWTCEVIHVDPFGNATTNLPGQTVVDEVDAAATAVLHLHGERIEAGIHETYGYGSGSRPFMTIGSAGLAELALREDSFAQAYDVEVGDRVKVQFLPRADPRSDPPEEE